MPAVYSSDKQLTTLFWRTIPSGTQNSTAHHLLIGMCRSLRLLHRTPLRLSRQHDLARQKVLVTWVASLPPEKVMGLHFIASRDTYVPGAPIWALQSRFWTPACRADARSGPLDPHPARAACASPLILLNSTTGASPKPSRSPWTALGRGSHRIPDWASVSRPLTPGPKLPMHIRWVYLLRPRPPRSRDGVLQSGPCC